MLITFFLHPSLLPSLLPLISSGGLGTLLCGASQNEGWMPLNKNLWSFSFVCVMGGTGMLALALYYFIIDVKGWWNGSPFRFVGACASPNQALFCVLRRYESVDWLLMRDIP